jgi:hypothetical protein
MKRKITDTYLDDFCDEFTASTILKNKENKLDKFITNNDIIKFVKYKKIKQTNNNLDTTNKRRSLSF